MEIMRGICLWMVNPRVGVLGLRPRQVRARILTLQLCLDELPALL